MTIAIDRDVKNQIKQTKPNGHSMHVLKSLKLTLRFYFLFHLPLEQAVKLCLLMAACRLLITFANSLDQIQD